jgi:hypothetical protein
MGYIMAECCCNILGINLKTWHHYPTNCVPTPRTSTPVFIPRDSKEFDSFGDWQSQSIGTPSDDMQFVAVKNEAGNRHSNKNPFYAYLYL